MPTILAQDEDDFEKRAAEYYRAKAKYLAVKSLDAKLETLGEHPDNAQEAAEVRMILEAIKRL